MSVPLLPITLVLSFRVMFQFSDVILGNMVAWHFKVRLPFSGTTYPPGTDTAPSVAVRITKEEEGR